MSLKAFHVVFITAASAMTLACGVVGIKNYFSAEGRAGDLVFGCAGVAVAVGLIFYERYFLKKTKDLGYL